MPIQSKTSDDKTKPFRLVKVFTFTSLIVMFAGTIILSFLNAYWIRTMLLKTSEDYAIVLVENLNHQVFLQFIIPVALKYGKIQLSNQDQFERMDKVVRSTLHTFNVDHVNIYDMDNVISYSFKKNLIGKKNTGGTFYYNAVKGKTSSNLIQTGNLFEILTGFPQESKIITFAPLRAEQPLSRISGPVLGVVEIVQDLSEEYKTIYKLQIKVIQTCAIVMGILFLILRYFVKRGENIINRRTRERLKLREQLDHAKHLSSLGEMTASISHEIRNPLGIISSSADLLKKKMSKTDPSSTIPDIIIEESKRLNDIITDFLKFAKPQTPIRNKCNLNEIIEKNISFLNMEFKGNRYLIEKHYDQNRIEIMADPNMLYQAFLNILINSIQAMPDGGTIQIEMTTTEKNVYIRFKDNGQGISEAVTEKIWNPFFTTKERGTGLGLGIVKNIIEAHKGNISIDNIQPGGVCVSISLPLNQG